MAQGLTKPLLERPLVFQLGIKQASVTGQAFELGCMKFGDLHAFKCRV